MARQSKSGTIFKDQDGGDSALFFHDPVTDTMKEVSKAVPLPIDGGPDGYCTTVTADNAAATVTKTGTANKSWYITGLHFSFSVANTGKLATLADGGTTIGNFHVMSTRDITFKTPIKITAGANAVVSLAASGTGTQIGAVTVDAYQL